eukprot:10791305-Lingulodinium_polyedra.AAC.1
MDCSWTTTTVEQQHSTTALVGRHHPDFGAESLVTRALLLSFRRLLPCPDPREQLKAKLVQKLHRLMGKNPSMLSGKQLYMQELCALAKEMKLAGKP